MEEIENDPIAVAHAQQMEDWENAVNNHSPVELCGLILIILGLVNIEIS